MTDAISQIKYDMNARMPIHRLPPELLTLIFEYASFRDQRYAFRNALRREEDAWRSAPAHRTLIRITHVCRVWRSIACAAAHLWACVDNSRLWRLKTFNRRSKAAPLSLVFRGATSSGLKRLFEGSGSRLRRLDISYSDRLFLPDLKFDGSRLECVTVGANFTCMIGPAGVQSTAAFEESISTLKGLALGLWEGYWLPSMHFPSRFVSQRPGSGAGVGGGAVGRARGWRKNS